MSALGVAAVIRTTDGDQSLMTQSRYTWLPPYPLHPACDIRLSAAVVGINS